MNITGINYLGAKIIGNEMYEKSGTWGRDTEGNVTFISSVSDDSWKVWLHTFQITENISAFELYGFVCLNEVGKYWRVSNWNMFYMQSGQKVRERVVAIAEALALPDGCDLWEVKILEWVKNRSHQFGDLILLDDVTPVLGEDFWHTTERLFLEHCETICNAKYEKIVVSRISTSECPHQLQDCNFSNFTVEGNFNVKGSVECCGIFMDVSVLGVNTKRIVTLSRMLGYIRPLAEKRQLADAQTTNIAGKTVINGNGTTTIGGKTYDWGQILTTRGGIKPVIYIPKEVVISGFMTYGSWSHHVLHNVTFRLEGGKDTDRGTQPKMKIVPGHCDIMICYKDYSKWVKPMYKWTITNGGAHHIYIYDVTKIDAEKMVDLK